METGRSYEFRLRLATILTKGIVKNFLAMGKIVNLPHHKDES